ncbi:MAG: hypothetical protein B7Y36_12745 [Novosphingobium sp. 28-62-57]|uniref:hypothetical protein n=1 Tax=unclassified Novosphingobium TaxID=2644732 RepID=UPI000BCED4D6|nr:MULTISPECIES: hypothetical protein [unclassified Novosphingobium]OYW49152.1 MAG: hypothetical protein B7Z34_10185 [Novosphingobium sp. 12-62-10]OYZ09821.1 MAG: hypothetical protein B7Y36_12745 [Novosphingobium sp. 28-62-57]OZA31655.1 MAG: hypothetical protein B7X92_13840 [Novosphingobium sp. 17-62-9]HQS70538.1 hypothetical protein [Novosphingobium sp.]
MVISSPLPLKAKLAEGHPFFALIEQAYHVFKYPKPTSTEVCQNCCMDRKIEASFFKPPIRELPLEYVQDWYDAAYDPDKGVAKATWAYLLPRLLEILAAAEEPTRIGLEVCLQRFDTGIPTQWSAKEWEILDRFQRKFLYHRVEYAIEFLDDVICMFKLGGWALGELLEQVEAMPSEMLALRLWNDWCGSCLPGLESIWLTTFWQGADSTEMLRFYTSDRLYAKMEALALGDGVDPAIAAKASAVAALMRP